MKHLRIPLSLLSCEKAINFSSEKREDVWNLNSKQTDILKRQQDLVAKMREMDLWDFVTTEQDTHWEGLKRLSVFGWLQGAGAWQSRILSLRFSSCTSLYNEKARRGEKGPCEDEASCKDAINSIALSNSLTLSFSSVSSNKATKWLTSHWAGEVPCETAQSITPEYFHSPAPPRFIPPRIQDSSVKMNAVSQGQ